MVKKEEKKSWRLWIRITLAILIVSAFIGYIVYANVIDKKKHRPSSSGGGGSSGPYINYNPTYGMTTQEAVAGFNQTFVAYLLSSMGVSQLHNPPLSSSTPKIQIEVDELVFHAEIKKGSTYIGQGSIADQDIIIRTTREEAVKMLQDRGYVATSFQSGNSGITLVAGKATLLAKGYMKIYEQFS